MGYVLPIFCTATGCILALLNSIFVFIPTENSFHFNLITVNSLFGGFLFTNYSLLLGLMDNNIIEKIKNTSLIEKRNRHISCGIIYATISVISGLYVVVFSYGDSLLSKVLYLLALNAELVFMAFVIGAFILSLHEMNSLVIAVNKSNKKKSNEELSQLRNKIILSARLKEDEE